MARVQDARGQKILLQQEHEGISMGQTRFQEGIRCAGQGKSSSGREKAHVCIGTDRRLAPDNMQRRHEVLLQRRIQYFQIRNRRGRRWSVCSADEFAGQGKTNSPNWRSQGVQRKRGGRGKDL